MPPKTPQPNSNDNHLVLRIHKKLAGLVGLLLVVAIVVGGYWYYHNHHHKSIAPIQLYKYSYSKLGSYELTGGLAGSGMSFMRPAELGGSKAIVSGGKTAMASQAATQNNQNHTIAQFAAASVSSTVSTSKYAATLGSILTNPQNPSYNTVIVPLKQFVASRIGASYTINFDTPAAFQNDNIKSNAWKIDFTAKPADPTAVLLPNMQGEEVFAAGAKTYYYFFIDAVDYNWQANQSVFSQVINSLKIDQ